MELKSELRGVRAAVGFLTRLPVGDDIDGEDVRCSGSAYPVVGAAIGGLTGALAARSGAAVALALQTVLTGALHLDGLADSADALGTADRERALEIMRDSRIGSFGTAAICLDLMIRAAALERLEAPARVAAGAGACSRAAAVALAVSVNPARSGGGASSALSQTGGARAAVALGLAAAISRDPGALGITTLVCVGSARFWRRRVGGMTGDTLGATVELCELAILVWSGRGR